MNLSFLPESQKAENGVFSYFRKKRILNKYMEAFGSKEYSSYYKPENIFNLDPNYFYSSHEETNTEHQHVGFTFKFHSFIPMFYTISQYNGENHSLKHFKLEASLSRDEIDDWEEIDSHNENEYCIIGLLPTFQIDSQFWKPFKRFRIKRSGYNCQSMNYFRVGGIELFGQLSGSCHIFNPCSLNSKQSQNYVFIFFLFLLPNK